MPSQTETTSSISVWGVVGQRGSDVFMDEESGERWEWARCHKAGCQHYVCRRLSDLYCWKHVDGLPTGAEFVESLKENAHV